MINCFFNQLASDHKKKQFLSAAYNYVVGLHKFAYFICRTDPDTPEMCRYMTNIFPDQYPVLVFSQEDDIKKF